MKRIKPLTSNLKLPESELLSENIDLRTVDTNIVVKALEENIELRSTPIDKRKLVLK